jgi:cobalt-zinc-cadmium resistance protein CzcA
MKLLNYIVEWSLNHRAIVLAATGVFLAFGLYSAKNLKLDAIPDITNVQVQIVTSAPSLSAWEMEQYVTYPVEWGVSGIPKVEEIRSISRYGISLVTVVFEEGTDIMLARQLVGERMIDLQKSIPPQYGIPEIGPLSTALGEVVQFTLSSDTHTAAELTTTLQWYMTPILKTVPGIVDVNLFGGEIKQYEIILDMTRMQSLGIQIQDVIDSVEKNNLSEGGGYIERNREHTIIGTNSLLTGTDDIGNIFIKTNSLGTPITLKQFARIVEGSELRKGAASQDGQREVVGGIGLMLTGENSLKTSKAFKEELEKLEPTLPEGMKISVFYDRSEMVLSTIRTILLNLGEGAILVIIILFIMLGDFRAGVIIAVVIPLCMLFAISIMGIRDAPANLMSMGAIDFGLLVDGAVIVIENASRRLGLKRQELGRNFTSAEKKEVILKSTVEVRKATVFGEAIIGVVYIPILVLSGTEGMLFKPMALTVLYALVGAFIFTLTLVPVLAYYFLREPKTDHEETPIFQWIRKKYEPILDRILYHQKKVILATVGFFFFTLVLFQFLGREFIPVLDEGSTLLEVTRLPSTSLSESVRTGMRLERILLSGQFPEVTGVISKTGSPNLALEPMGIEKSDVFIQLKPRKEWNRSKEELLDKISEAMEEELPEVAFGLSQPIEMRTNEMVAGIRSDIGIKIFGEDLNILIEEGKKTASIVKKIPGVRDIRIEQLGGVSYIQVVPNQEKLARYGLDAREIGRITKMISAGLPINKLIDGAKRFDIVLKLENPPNDNTASWQSILVPTRSGSYVPLGDIATIQKLDGPSQISHEWQERRLLIEFNVRGKDVVSVVEEVQEILAREGSLPPGYRYEYDGNFKNYISARDTLFIIVPITLVLILLLLWFAVNDVIATILLFFNIPFAITGGILSLFLRGLPFSISAGIGFIALSGVAILNSLVLVTFAKELEKKGDSPRDAIHKAALLRVRPVVMTGLVAMLGFIPMALSTNPGAEVQRPLATVVIGGLISDGLLTLFVFPVFYTWAHERFFFLTGRSKKQS